MPLMRRLRIVALLSAGLIVAGCGPSVSAAPTATGGASTEPTAAVAPSPSSAMPSTLPSLAAGPGRIVFAQFVGQVDFFDIYTINPDGSNLRLVLSGKHAIPRWSPDGRRIEVVTSSLAEAKFVTIINADGTGVRDLVRPDPALELRCLAWSPDGQRLVCEGWDPRKAGREGLYTVRTSDGGGLQRLTDPHGAGNDVPGAYSPDGTQIVFVRQTYAPVALGQLWVCDADGSNVRKITDTLTSDNVSWSPDGRWIAGSANGSLLVFDLTNLASPPRQIVIPKGSAMEPRWSPDGSRLVFSFIRSGATVSDVYTVNVDGSDPAQLTTSLNQDASADWGNPP